MPGRVFERGDRDAGAAARVGLKELVHLVTQEMLALTLEAECGTPLWTSDGADRPEPRGLRSSMPRLPALARCNSMDLALPRRPTVSKGCEPRRLIARHIVLPWAGVFRSASGLAGLTAASVVIQEDK